MVTPTHDIASDEIVKTPVETVAVVEENYSYEPAPIIMAKSTVIVGDAYPNEPVMSQEDIELIALVTMAEAEGECEEGKRLVIDTILNRVDSELSYFPDTVREVIYQKNAFESLWNGRIDRCYVDDYICELVREELESRTNHDVMYFTAGAYGKYGTPMFAVGNHYFSSK